MKDNVSMRFSSLLFMILLAVAFTLTGCGGGGSSGGGDIVDDGGGTVPEDKITLEDANDQIAAFIDSMESENPSEEDFNELMDTLNGLEDSQEANLYKAFAELLDMYNSPALSQILENLNLGVDIGFDTKFEFVEESGEQEPVAEELSLQSKGVEIDDTELDLDQIAYDYLQLAVYDSDIQDLLSETVTRLGNVDAKLEQAQGEEFSISFQDLDRVYIDSIDIKLARTFVKLTKAVFMYLQAIDISVDNYFVTFNDEQVDIRDFAMIDEESVDYPTDEQWRGIWQEFTTNNSTLGTYSDRSLLSLFRAEIGDAYTLYSSAIDDLEGLGQSGRRDRYHNAFNLDNEYYFFMAKAFKDHVFLSILNCLDDGTAVLRNLDTFDGPKGEEYIDGGDGFYYLREYHTVYVETNEPAIPDYTIYSLFNVNGSKAPRDLIKYVHELPEDVVFEPYVLNSTANELIGVDIPDTYWDDPVETFSVPLATITINGDTADWASVPEAPFSSDDTIRKLARDDNDNFYLLIQKVEPTSFPTLGSWFYSGYMWLGMRYGWSGYSWDYFEAGLNSNCNSNNPTLSYSAYEQDNYSSQVQISDDDISPLNTGTGVEIKYNNFVHLARKGSINWVGGYRYFSYDENPDSNFYEWHHMDIKFLPEFEPVND
jgi:hypothetical protein